MKTLFATAALLMSSTALAGEIRTERVTFQSQGETLVGTLYLPDGAGSNSPMPATVVTGAWMTVKEQMPANHARALAERGVIALTFDYRGWGESASGTRDLESPTMKIADISAAASYLAARLEVTTGGVGLLGICASAGYAVSVAAAGTAPVRSLALVAPWIQDRAVVEQVYGGADGVARLIAVGREAAASSTLRVVPAASTTDRNAIMFGAPYYTEAGRGLIPQWGNRIDLSFWEGWLNFDSMAPAAAITVPTLMVQSDAAALPASARRFYAALRAPKSQLWLDGVSQFDFYDRPDAVARTADAVALHFQQTL